MARSVSTPRNAVVTVYLNQPFDNPEENFEAFDDFIQDLRQVLDGSAGAPGGKGFASFKECDRWLDREDHAVLENGHAVVTVSEYNGIVAVCLVPKGEDELGYDYGRIALAEAWAHVNSGSFEKLLHGAYENSALRSQGRASNGEQFFSLVNTPGELNGSLVTSKEGRLW